MPSRRKRARAHAWRGSRPPPEPVVEPAPWTDSSREPRAPPGGSSERTLALRALFGDISVNVRSPATAGWRSTSPGIRPCHSPSVSERSSISSVRTRKNTVTRRASRRSPNSSTITRWQRSTNTSATSSGSRYIKRSYNESRAIEILPVDRVSASARTAAAWTRRGGRADRGAPDGRDRLGARGIRSVAAAIMCCG